MTDDDAVRVLGWIASAYPRVQITDATVEIWAVVLSDIPREVGEAAVRRIIATQQRAELPTPGAVRRQANLLMGRAVPSPERAWAEVRSAIANGGRGGQPKWSHKVVADAVAAIGWWELCTSEQPSVLRGQFLRLAASFAEEQAEEQMLPPELRASPAPLSIAPALDHEAERKDAM